MYAIYDYDYANANGRRMRLTDRTFASVAEAEQWLRDEYDARRIPRGDYAIEDTSTGVPVA